MPNRPRWRGLALFALPIIAALLFLSCGGEDSTTADPTDSTSSTVDDGDSSDTTGTSSADSSGSADSDTEDDDEGAASDAEIATAEPVVYADDYGTSIAPIFANRCASCHSRGGPGSTHWSLATAQDTVQSHEAIATIVSSRTMPPWPAGGESPHFTNDRSLTDDQIDAILDWSDAGAPLDVAADAPIEPVNGVASLVEPDVLITPAEPYAGVGDVPDDYRCQIYDPQLPDGGWITAYEFQPDATEVVHHAIGYLIPAAARTSADELDGADGRAGWECYGSSGLGNDDIFLGWAPGQLVSEFPEGTGLWVEPGAFIVIQVHYHYDEAVLPDASALALTVEAGGRESADIQAVIVTEYIAPAEIPCSTEESGPLCDRDAALAAAIDRYGREGVLADDALAVCGFTPEDFADMTDGTATSQCDIPPAFLGGTGEVISILGHEHEIGSWFKMTLNPDTSEEKVLLDIPDWDFDWQYNYTPSERIVIDSDDIIRIECGWDRSRRDPELEPAYVLWADGTNDEMCFATVTTRPAS